MHSLTLLWLPVSALAVLAGVGAAPATVLGAGMPADARAALAVPLGGAVFACSSALLILHVPVKAAIGVVLVLSLPGAVALKSNLRGLFASAKIPLAVIAASLLFVSIPWMAMKSWEPATYGNGDPYLWVSQAKTYLDGPAPLPVSTHPDREAFNFISNEQWPVALPFGVAAVAWLSGSDPAVSYSAFAVLLAVLLALTAYIIGRALLEWSEWKAGAGALIVTTSAYLFFGTDYGWQAQIGLTTFSLASVTCFRVALDRPAGRREQLLAGLFAAAGIATYGSLILAFIPLFAAVLVGAMLHDQRDVALRSYARVVGGTTAAILLFGLIPVIWAVRSLDALGGSLSAADWKRYAHGIVPEALGLVPRSVDLGRPGLGWTVAGTFVTLAMVAVLVRLVAHGGRRFLGHRSDFLLSASTYFVVLMLVLRLPGFSPYWSMKIGGYGAPVLVLTAFAILAARPSDRQAAGRLVAYTRVAVACLFAISTAAGITQSLISLERSRLYAGLASNLARAAPRARVEIDVQDAWRQLWAVYYLRNTPVVVPHRTSYLTGFGAGRKPRPTVQPAYRLAVGKHPGAIWTGGGLTLRAIRP